jgi:cytochrome oxidase Cu insertion factor (SCO1/SenC/PrrC family)
MQLRHAPPALRTVLALIALAALVLAGCSDTTGEGLAVGDAAPDFELPAASGSTISLADFAGAPALLYFHMADG